MLKHKEVSKHECAAHWVINEKDVGTCKKYHPETLLCSDTGKKCPYGGIRDFGAMRRRGEKAPDWMKGKASLRGKRRHGNNNGYFGNAPYL